MRTHIVIVNEDSDEDSKGIKDWFMINASDDGEGEDLEELAKKITMQREFAEQGNIGEDEPWESFRDNYDSRQGEWNEYYVIPFGDFKLAKLDKDLKF